MKKCDTTQTLLECPKCNRTVEIWRKTSKQKKKGHTKHMWCPYCNEIVGFVELKNTMSDDGWVSLAGKITLKNNV